MQSLSTINQGISNPADTHSLNTIKPQRSICTTIFLALTFLPTIGGTLARYLYLQYKAEHEAKCFAHFAAEIANAADLTNAKAITLQLEDGDISLVEVQRFGHTHVVASRWDATEGYVTLDLDPQFRSLREIQTKIQHEMVSDSGGFERFGVTVDPVEWEFQTAFRKGCQMEGPQLPLDHDGLNTEPISSVSKASGGKLSQVTKIVYRESGTYFFKPDRPDPIIGDAGEISGILVGDHRLGYRAIFSYHMSQALGFDVVPETVMTVNQSGQRGYAMKQAPGKSCHDYLVSSLKDRDPDRSIKRLTNNPVTVRSAVQLQLLDALTGQADRHSGNYFIDESSGKVTGIDSDVCGGASITHPHQLVSSRENDAFHEDVRVLAKREKALVDNWPVEKRGRHGALDFMQHGGQLAPQGVMLPPIMDSEMVDKFKAMTAAEVIAIMRPLKFNANEMRAACSRLTAIKQHIRVLEQRQALYDRNPTTYKDRLSIIRPDQWGSREVLSKMFPNSAQPAAKLMTATSYLHRDTGLVTGKFRPIWLR